jgi:CRISPR system Cascade subunit CasA
MTTFDLVTAPWIPVVAGGQRAEVSLMQALTEAHDIDGLALAEPLVAVAILRQVLLPVVLDACGAPSSEDAWAERWAAGRLDRRRITDYLQQHADRFDLFHPTRPFGQVAGLRTDKNETKPVSLLLPALATGNSVPLFSSRTEADPPALSLAEAVRATLSAHCWDVAGIKSGAVGDPGVRGGKGYGSPTGPLGSLGVVVPMGKSLAATVNLNLPVLTSGIRGGDRPQWRSDPQRSLWQQRPALGLLDLLTWQSRRIRLIPEPPGGDGAGDAVVREVVLASGDRLDPLPVDVEPHTQWRRVDPPAAGKAPHRPLRHQVHRSAWEGLPSLLATGRQVESVSTSFLLQQLADLRAEDLVPADMPLQVLSVGIEYGSQSAVVTDVMADTVPLPVAALTARGDVRQLLIAVVAEAEALRVAANRLGDGLRQAGGGEKISWDQGQRLGDSLLHDLTPYVRRLLSGLQREPDRLDEAQTAWRDTARAAARAIIDPAVQATAPSAFAGRAGAKPVSVAIRYYEWAITEALGERETAGPPNHDHQPTQKGELR